MHYMRPTLLASHRVVLLIIIVERLVRHGSVRRSAALGTAVSEAFVAHSLPLIRVPHLGGGQWREIAATHSEEFATADSAIDERASPSVGSATSGPAGSNADAPAPGAEATSAAG